MLTLEIENEIEFHFHKQRTTPTAGDQAFRCGFDEFGM